MRNNNQTEQTKCTFQHGGVARGARVCVEISTDRSDFVDLGADVIQAAVCASDNGPFNPTRASPTFFANLNMIASLII
jgi:hypothetical protein